MSEFFGAFLFFFLHKTNRRIQFTLGFFFLKKTDFILFTMMIFPANSRNLLCTDVSFLLIVKNGKIKRVNISLLEWRTVSNRMKSHWILVFYQIVDSEIELSIRYIRIGRRS